ncbi:hypothetical protein MPTK1_5g14720 [Marchantia polymorpha subsp. ruderalis]|uniref:Transmembrane protein n=2 Tax=Marchantia polymorpha TaxID=3197 RepID=A0AAF6BIF0_MARPO|nr:hypothetical protein MARPO_0032s0163 [Marchantia polymorpha]BBN11784.1 hypothetical protein Mp_5g14720 [Marchantia polymorpha subsp. ruderalis]|eukprot:PTQ42001.1 hypothetical protein MARPO_0032s0163 [Marchantia polymorpha]
MVDLASLIIAVILFIVLSPGLLFQIPGEDRPLEFGTHNTSLPSVLVHAALFLVFFYLLQLGFGVHGGTKSEFI